MRQPKLWLRRSANPAPCPPRPPSALPAVDCLAGPPNPTHPIALPSALFQQLPPALAVRLLSPLSDGGLLLLVLGLVSSHLQPVFSAVHVPPAGAAKWERVCRRCGGSGNCMVLWMSRCCAHLFCGKMLSPPCPPIAEDTAEAPCAHRPRRVERRQEAGRRQAADHTSLGMRPRLNVPRGSLMLPTQRQSPKQRSKGAQLGRAFRCAPYAFNVNEALPGSSGGSS